MGLLNDLKNRADELRAGQEKETALKARREAFYSEQMRPALRNAMSYLDELINLISFVHPEILVRYPLSPDQTRPITLRQGGYRIVVDSSERPLQVDIRFQATLAAPAIFNVEGKNQVLEYAEYLDQYGLRYQRRDGRYNVNGSDRATFSLEGPLHLSATILADIEQQRMHVILRNFDSPGLQRHSFHPEQLDHDLLDRLGKVILREDKNLVDPVNVSEEAMAELRRKLEEQRLLQPEEPDDNGEEYVKKKNWLKRTFNLLQAGRSQWEKIRGK